MRLTKSRLAIQLSKLKLFDNPDPALEQYPTDSEVASDILWKALISDHLTTIADLGAGTGILGLGAAVLGAEKVYLIEKDDKALKLAKENKAYLEQTFEELPTVFENITIQEFNTKVDTVIMNPPFGIQNVHADKVFLEKAFQIANNIYSLHKIESKQFIEQLAQDNNFVVKEIIQFEFPLKSTMKHHKQRIRRIKVGCWIMERVLSN